jgi:hypothetical protein
MHLMLYTKYNYMQWKNYARKYTKTSEEYLKQIKAKQLS